MKILMFGRGVISVLYGMGARKSGCSVEFYVRPGRATQYGSAVALDILDARRSIFGKRVNECWAISMREDLPTDHDYNLILVSVQHYHFEEVSSFLGPRVGKATVLVLSTFG